MNRASFIASFCFLILPAASAAAQQQPQQPPAATTAPTQQVATSAAAEARAHELGDRIDVTMVNQEGTSVQWGRGEAVVDIPYATALATVTDYAHYQEWVPHFNVSRVLSRRGANALVYMQASVIRNTTTLWAQLRIFARRPQRGTQVVEARMIEGNMERFQARWELTPIDGGTRTLVAFQILVDPDLPLPSSVFNEENRKAARRTVQALRRRIGEHTAVAHNP